MKSHTSDSIYPMKTKPKLILPKLVNQSPIALNAMTRKKSCKDLLKNKKMKNKKNS